MFPQPDTGVFSCFNPRDSDRDIHDFIGDRMNSQAFEVKKYGKSLRAILCKSTEGLRL